MRDAVVNGQAANSFCDIRVTEYTTRDEDASAMPGELPPASAYTYALELRVAPNGGTSFDQANFNSPVFVYTTDFLGFPVGTSVPAGTYKRYNGLWEPVTNPSGTAKGGKVVEVQDQSGTLVFVGDTVAAAEKDAIATAVGRTAGQKYWRVLVVERKADPSFGLGVTIPQATLTLPSTKSVSVELARSIVGPAFSPTQITETTTVKAAAPDNTTLSRSLVVQPTASPPIATFTSAGNRKVKLTFDDKGRVLEAELDPPSTDLAKVSVQYDNQGRVDKVTQGTRELKLDYANASGFLTKVTQSSTSSSDTRVIEYKQHDGVGRPRTVTLPGAHDLGLLYDGNGNMTSVTPPGKSAHGLEPTDVDLLWKHTSPVVGGSSATSQWDYDKDRRPWKFTRADSATPLEAVWDPNHTDRLLRVVTADGNYTPEYDLVSGALKKWTTPGGIVTEAGLDGPRLTGMSTTWPGSVVGSVSWTADGLLRVNSETVTGGWPVNVTEFDPDGKIKTAEVANTTCSVDFVASTGWTKSLTVGNVVIDMVRHPSYGEVSSITAKYNGTPFYTATAWSTRW